MAGKKQCSIKVSNSNGSFTLAHFHGQFRTELACLVMKIFL